MINSSLLSPLPENHAQALEWLMQLVSASDGNILFNVERSTFKRGWFSIGFLYAGLHPDSANHGEHLTWHADEPVEMNVPDQRLLFPYHTESGWPKVLTPIQHEAWHRYVSGQLSDDEFYCTEAVMAGMVFRNPALLSKFQSHSLSNPSSPETQP